MRTASAFLAPMKAERSASFVSRKIRKSRPKDRDFRLGGDEGTRTLDLHSDSVAL